MAEDGWLMDYAPFWPFSSVPTLTFKRRGDVLRAKDPNYDGTYDEIDEQYNVEVAEFEDICFEVSNNGDKQSIRAHFFWDKLWWADEFETREECYAWAQRTLEEKLPECRRLLQISAQFEPGLYLVPTYYDGTWWHIVSLSKENGIARLWYFGSEIPEIIDQADWQNMQRFTLTAPDGTIVGE